MIEGTNLLQGGAALISVELVDVPARIVFANDSLVVVDAGSGYDVYTTGNVTLMNNVGAEYTVVGGWSYVVPSDIDALEPAVGQVSSVVTIHGRSLLVGGATVEMVSLAGVPVSSIVSATNETIVVVAGSPWRRRFVVSSNRDAGSSRRHFLVPLLLLLLLLITVI